METGRINSQCKRGKQMIRRGREERELNKAEQSKGNRKDQDEKIMLIKMN